MSTAHISDDLPLLLSGEANRDVVMDAADHLRSCPDCQQDLVSAVVAHASLTSAHRFAPEIVAAGEDEPRDAEPVETPPVESLPDLSGVFAQVRVEAEAEAARPSKRRRALVAVAAAVVVAGGATAVVESTGGSSTPAPTAQQVTLNSPRGGPSSTATMLGPNRMKVDATSLPKLNGGKQYEVWLTKSGSGSQDEPQSVGYIGADRKADLSIPAKVIAQYNTVSVSVQKPSQVKYSGELVLYGAYGD